MLSTLVILAGFWLSHSVVEEHECRGAETTLEMTTCLERRVKEVERVLVVRIGEVSESSSGTHKRLFEESQSEWLRFRDVECRAIREFYREGTLSTVAYLKCKLSLTEERLNWIKGVYAGLSSP